MFKKLKESATLMTWGSFVVRAANSFVILPMILGTFSDADVAAWLLFTLVLNIVYLTDLGFSQSFSRAISYAFGGAEKITKFFGKIDKESEKEPNWTLIGELMIVMSKVYRWLAIIGFMLIATFGSLAVNKTISATENSSTYWIAWGVIVLTAPICIYGILFTTYLMGINKIALIKFWDIVFSLFSISISLIIVKFSPSILYVVINTQFWLIVAVLRNLILVKKQSQEFSFMALSYDKELFAIIWATSWRSAVGLIMAYGLLQMTGVFFAQMESSAQVASYLLALRIMTTLVDFSRAPFYSKLPQLSILRAKGSNDELVKVAWKGMLYTQWVYLIGVLAVSLLHEPLLHLIHSKTVFVDNKVWALMGCAFFFERYGSIHLQLYTITNHIIWHKVNFVSAILTIVLIWLSYSHLYVLAFPFAMLISNAFWTCWYTASHSYKEYKFNFFRFETVPNLIPLTILIIQYLMA